VDRLLRTADASALIAEFGRTAVTEAIRSVLAALREAPDERLNETSLFKRVSAELENARRPSPRPVFNLTGTVLHTNLGRAPLPEEAIEAVAMTARAPTNLEYDLTSGARGDRDHHLEAQLCRLTGAEAATVVNNNAAAVMLALNTLANRKEVPASRGELIEIGGSFRLPDIMAASGCRLREIGTTNRTHLSDYEAAIGPKTGLVIKVHTSNYSIEGFTASVAQAGLARLCRDRGVPLLVDLGSGALLDLRPFGLPHEPTPAESLADGADLVTFSGDKLLGGPQAGIIVGRADLIQRIKRNAMKRALRVDKMTIAALSAVLRLYGDPDRLAERLPALRALARPVAHIRETAHQLCGILEAKLAPVATVATIECESQVGSGAQPTQRIASVGVAITPLAAKRGAGAALNKLASAFRNLPIPVLGRIHGGALILDCRCLEDQQAFVAQLSEMAP
jgi:L-seryl-tRNA(Ser) seleniumtransferase